MYIHDRSRYNMQLHIKVMGLCMINKIYFCISVWYESNFHICTVTQPFPNYKWDISKMEVTSALSRLSENKLCHHPLRFKLSSMLTVNNKDKNIKGGISFLTAAQYVRG
jgi:hypothetical protein